MIQFTWKICNFKLTSTVYCKGEIIQLKLWVWPRCACLLKGYKRKACHWLVRVAKSNVTTKTVRYHCIYVIMPFKGLFCCWEISYYGLKLTEWVPFQNSYSHYTVFLRLKPYGNIKLFYNKFQFINASSFIRVTVNYFFLHLLV